MPLPHGVLPWYSRRRVRRDLLPVCLQHQPQHCVTSHRDCPQFLGVLRIMCLHTLSSRGCHRITNICVRAFSRHRVSGLIFLISTVIYGAAFLYAVSHVHGIPSVYYLLIAASRFLNFQFQCVNFQFRAHHAPRHRRLVRREKVGVRLARLIHGSRGVGESCTPWNFCTDFHTSRLAPQILGEGLKKVCHVSRAVRI